MAVFSGNPADRATGNVQPGSLREASGGGMSNGTSRNNNFGGGLANSTGDRGFSAGSGGANKDQSRISPSLGMKDQSRISSTSMKDQSRITPERSFPTRPVSLTPGPKLSVESPSYQRGIADSLTSMGQRGLGYISSIDRANVASEATAKAVRGLTPRTSKAPTMSTGPVSRGTQVMERKPVGGPINILSPRPSTGPVPRNAPPTPASISFQSTGPVSRKVQAVERKPIGPMVEVTKPRPRPTTVAEVRKTSQKNKATAVQSRTVKGGYLYNRVGNVFQNFSAGSGFGRKEK